MTEEINPLIYKTVYNEAGIVIFNIIFKPGSSVNNIYVSQISQFIFLYVYVDDDNMPIGMDWVSNSQEAVNPLMNINISDTDIDVWYKLCCKKVTELDARLVEEGTSILRDSLENE